MSSESPSSPRILCLHTRLSLPYHPCSPLSPVAPGGPCIPCGPGRPRGPDSPLGPSRPHGPGLLGPGFPFTPLGPRSPWSPSFPGRPGPWDLCLFLLLVDLRVGLVVPVDLLYQLRLVGPVDLLD